MYYSANWQLIEEELDDDVDGSFSVDRRMQYVWGQRYIDDIIMRRQDSNDDGTFDQTWYHITDTLFSTVAILDDAAKLVERVSYDAYGNARHHSAGDFIGDGATSVADLNNVILANWGSYGAGDMNRDGIVNGTDMNMLLGDFGTAQPAGRISTGAGGTDNILGYAGYIFNAEVPGYSSSVDGGLTAGLYTVRHRHYAPDLGRWLSRDPLGYVDGISLYEYVRRNALRYHDPVGTVSYAPPGGRIPGGGPGSPPPVPGGGKGIGAGSACCNHFYPRGNPDRCKEREACFDGVKSNDPILGGSSSDDCEDVCLERGHTREREYHACVVGCYAYRGDCSEAPPPRRPRDDDEIKDPTDVGGSLARMLLCFMVCSAACGGNVPCTAACTAFCFGILM